MTGFHSSPAAARRPLGLALVVALAASGAARPADAQGRLAFSGAGHTVHGDWRADGTATAGPWRSGLALQVDVDLTVAEGHLASLAAAGIRADRLCLLVTAERTFDATGWMRLPSDERMSTLLTPTGLAIEGGVQGAVTDRYGYAFRTPFDVLVTVPVSQLAPEAGTRRARFTAADTLPASLPPGLYRLRLDFGVMAGARTYNLNGYAFAARPSTDQAGTSTYFYTPVIPASGRHASGADIDGTRIQARFPWLLLAGYNSNGYRGVVADQDRARFATSDRSLIPDEVILPRFDEGGKRLSYSLEPQFPADGIDPLQNVAWSWTSGELSVRVFGPDGSVDDLGTAPFVAKSGNGPTTRKAAFTAWTPRADGRYTVVATGWIADRAGRRYEGGGTYRFWIARRMTLATATFQGMPYPVGSRYGRDIQFNPAVPADVTVTAHLYVGSDRVDVRTLAYSGKATPAGMFGAAQGMLSFPLDAPGEYDAHVLATYTDREGALWVCSMRHAGIVYAPDSPLVARGKMLTVGGRAVERGRTGFEGYVGADGEQHLAHLTFPYLSGDVLLIAAEGQGANKVEPVLTYQMKGDPAPWDTRLNGVGTTNLRINTSNGLSPHLFPEYITDREYYYGAAPRPGFMGRFLVGESTVRAPYWPVSPNAFGGQIGASPNGDAPGDIYRLIGGVVRLTVGKPPLYAGYIASAFLLPRGTNDNRVVEAGSEDLHGPMGTKARFFLVGLRPGTAFGEGSSFRPALQIDPLLPVAIQFTLTYPDGRQRTASGVGDAFGSFAGPEAWTLDVPGLYRYQVHGTWNGFRGGMPGLPEEGGTFFVYSKDRPAGPGLALDGPSERTFSAGSTLTLTGTSTASVVHYTAITPGAVIEQGDLPVSGGRFQYVFDPAAVHRKVPLYDVVSITTGRPQIGRVVHLSFFAQERAPGASSFQFARVILRGTTAVSPAVPTPPAVAAGSAAAAREGATEARGTRVAATDPEALGRADAALERLARESRLVLVSREGDTLVPHRQHERLRQLHEGVPVWGGDLTRQVEDGRPVSVFGTIYEGIAVDTRPRVGRDEAWAVAAHGLASATPAAAPALVILPLEDGGYALAWRVGVRGPAGSRTAFVDAAGGRLLLEYDEVRTAFAPGRLVPGEGPDPADVRARADAVAELYRQRFGRAGLDGRGLDMKSVVRAAAPAALPRGARGTWDGRVATVSSASPEVVAHELTHAVVDIAAGLVPVGEAGAIDEGFAELMGASAARPGNEEPLRRLLSPAGDAPALARAAAAVVARLGPESELDLERALYRALVYLLPPTADLAMARAASLQSVRDLLGSGSDLETALAEAWPPPP